ncbi:MAG: YggS family pyridoxal phosphate-dependent enzyme [Alphaproteobacteria bacterium]|nr:YggS family pyridoxal phosphate-dependent enzyme [Alphaproteobacteria bacterium]
MSVAENLDHIHTDIRTAAEDAQRDADDVTLVAVSKKQPPERIEEALEAGHKVFGENRVQEAYEHWEALKKTHDDLVLHLIGPLQSNKAADAVALFDVIETIDREKIAKTVAKEMAKQGRDLPCFIQVNTGEEEQKSGVVPARLKEFYDYCYYECGLKIIGLMCIPPIDEPPALHFSLLKKYAEQLGLSKLSMGMSADYEAAIKLGATHIRVGTGIFGERE